MFLESLSLMRIGMIVVSVVIVMVSASFHELAHGFVAYKLGDTTAKDAGRLTLNPAAHLDPIGSFALPLVLALAQGPIFAFAKPVPYNPYRLKNPQRDELLVALAGPASNLLLALVFSLILRLVLTQVTMFDLLGGEGVRDWVLTILMRFIFINLVLCFFNLIPLPPLDGSKIVSPFLKGEARLWYYKVEQYAMPVLLVVLFVLPAWFHVDPLADYLDFTAGNVFQLLLIGL